MVFILILLRGREIYQKQIVFTVNDDNLVGESGSCSHGWSKDKEFEVVKFLIRQNFVL